MPFDSRPPSGITENWQHIDSAGSVILNQFFEFFIEQKSVVYCNETPSPTHAPTPLPTPKPTRPPTSIPTPEPTPSPTESPTTPSPTPHPTTLSPTPVPTLRPTVSPTSLKRCLRVVGPNDQFNGFYVLWPENSISDYKYWVDKHSGHKIYVDVDNGLFSL